MIERKNQGVKGMSVQSHEDYLEAILVLRDVTNNNVRSVDVANLLNFSKPSVSVALKKLKEEDYIFMDEKMHIFLTASGLAIAEKVFEKHKVLTNFFISLGVNAQIAENDACAIEHIISEETFEAIKKRG